MSRVLYRPLSEILVAACPLVSGGMLLTANSTSAHAQEPGPQRNEVEEIVVTGSAPRGAIIGNTQPEQEFSPADIRSLGVSSISDLLAELSPQTNAAGGSPVVLLNGKRISGFSEIQDIPTEAIARVEILPEEVSLKYGYAANQKVVNVVLRPRFHAMLGDLRGGMATEGGRSNGQISAGLLNITGDNRLNLDVKYTAADRLLESDRGIIAPLPRRPYSVTGNILAPDGGEIDPGLSAFAGQLVERASVPASAANGRPQLSDFVAGANVLNSSDIGRFRTLSPSTDTLTLNGVLARALPGNISGSLNARLDLGSSDSLRGLPSASLLIPAGNPFSPFSRPVQLYRYFGQTDPLAQKTDTVTGHLGLTLNGDLKPWRWSFTGSYDRSAVHTMTERGIDTSALQSAIDAGSPALNPFGAYPADLLGTRLADRARSRSSDLAGTLLLNGPLIALPAGKAMASIRLGASNDSFNSRSLRSGTLRTAGFSRDTVDGEASVDIPIASRRSGMLKAVGDLSLNGNVAVQHLSDFGTLSTIGYGFNWTPIPQIRLIGSVSQDRAAPSGQQVDNPEVVTPNVPVFDYRTGQSLFISQISGGNPALRSSNRYQTRLSITLKPFKKPDMNLVGTYTRTRTDRPIASFPEPTTQIEDAFPDRFARDVDGTLTSIDVRPINFAQSRQSQLRWGFNLSLPIKSHVQKEIEAWRAAGGKPEDRPADVSAMMQSLRPRGEAGASADQSRGGGDSSAARRGFGSFSNGRGRSGRIQLALYHNWYFTDSVLIAPGLPKLDLLDGAAIGSQGGRPRHELQGQAGYSNNGLGGRLNLNWQSATHIDGTSGQPSTNLRFSSLATFNLRLFADFGQMPRLAKARSFLRGSRLTLSANNLFNARKQVRDGLGATPPRYQSAYFDPAGRVVTLSFRKLFY